MKTDEAIVILSRKFISVLKHMHVLGIEVMWISVSIPCGCPEMINIPGVINSAYVNSPCRCLFIKQRTRGEHESSVPVKINEPRAVDVGNQYVLSIVLNVLLLHEFHIHELDIRKNSGCFISDYRKTTWISGLFFKVSHDMYAGMVKIHGSNQWRVIVNENEILANHVNGELNVHRMMKVGSVSHD